MAPSMLPATSGMTILPQYQGDYYKLQNQQALAQALMGQSLQNQASLIPSNMAVMPKLSPWAGVAQLGQALLAGKEQNNVAQGYANLGQQQMAALMGTPAPAPSSAATGTSEASTMGAALSGSPVAQASPVSGSPAPQGQPAPMQQGQPAPSQGMPAPQGQPAPGALQGGLLSAGGPLNPNKMDPRAAAMMYLSGPEGQKELFKSAVSAYAPTAATLAARQGGMDPVAANRAQFQHDSSTTLSPNQGLYNPATGTTMTAPSAAPAGYQNIQGNDGKWYTVQVGGGPQAVAASAASELAGKNSQTPYSPVDKQGNPLPLTTVGNVVGQAGASTPGQPAPLGIRTFNPGNLRPDGQQAQYPDMTTGLKALDQNLQSYGKQGINTLSGVISKWAPPSENDTAAYTKDVSARLGIAPNQTIDLSNPLQRQAISTAIALHENGSNGVFGNSQSNGPSASDGQMYGAAPLGAQATATATAQGAINTMNNSYTALRSVRSAGPAALQDLTNMAQAAPGASPVTVGPYGSDLAALFSNDAKTYAKSRAHLVSTLGSQIGMNTDAGRSFVENSIPEYGAPREALQKGLANIQGQVQANMLKSDYLSPTYVSGNAKAYNTAENQFDQNITPNIANVIALPAGPARAAQLQTIRKQPGMESRLEWAASNGVLK